MFALHNVGVRYGKREILRDVSTLIEPGRLTVLCGPNGAGKSTLLKVLTGELAPASGRSTLDDRDLSAYPPALLATRRAVLPQASALAFPFTVLEVVRLGLDCRPGASVALRASAPVSALERVDLAGFGARRYEMLSGGEQQRVHLARVLCQIGQPVERGVPRYLFLDEPTSSLDIRHQIATLEIARDFARAGGGVFAILHDLNLAAAFADRLIVLSRGEIRADGTPAAILDDDLVAEVFGIRLRISCPPPAGMPYILPQSIHL